MKQTTPTIVLTGGGSGGHITPLLSLARELKRQAPGCTLVYIGHKGDRFDNLGLSKRDFDFMAFIKAGKFRRYHGMGFTGGVLQPKTLALNIRDFFRLPGSLINSMKLMRKFRPNVVFSKGGFVAVPVCLAAKLLKIPIVTHDSDTVPGLANRMVGRWATLHTTGMPTHHYPYPPDRTRYVGIPIDDRIKKVTPKVMNQAKAQLKLPKDSLVLLLSGGGNGSVRLNKLMLAVATDLLSSHLSLYLLHLCGPDHVAEVNEGYRALPRAERQRVRVLGFSPEFYKLSASADLVVSRAGATTLADLAVAGKACVVIPAPFLAGGHQLKNADELAKHDAAVVLDNEVQPDEFQAVINELLADDRRRFELARNLYSIAKPGASAELAKVIIYIAGY
ncbi:MAG TPA: UDP-N-acetylglucosamine--N-acetylmuramyl-(pentapeptide) pyrophosphoryl-undecaprenol N-acetylglucosamine transferase [Candidatus Saccharimonadales bacterium]|nr:UDP-N-acetylglucosamine--N-acetylmuramyl-(pentapeptide) pyrophosphoryl-undecaprenol N-acetylglucosamine transferase [Candidatus Saccharimonadales bacterium]